MAEEGRRRHRSLTSPAPPRASLDLSIAGNGDKGDELRVLVTPNDGTVNGAQVTSSAVAVVNSAPVCLAVDILTSEDTAGSTPPDCTDVDIDALTYTVTAAASGDSGTDGLTNLTFDPNGAFESLDDTEFGTDDFTYTASDGDASSVAADVNVTITGVNNAPVANNDTGSTSEDTNLNVAPGRARQRHRRRRRDTRSSSRSTALRGQRRQRVTLASGAMLTLNADGSFTYKPNGQFKGLDTGETATDSFTYTASDGTACVQHGHRHDHRSPASTTPRSRTTTPARPTRTPP